MVTGEAATMSGSTYLEDMLNMAEDVPEISEVTEFYNGCNVLVTGASGFLGKLIIEKLIRTCPKIGTVYMLMREKKGKTAEERLKEQFQNPVYQVMRREQPDYIKKVVMMEGDTGEIDLGLSPENRKILTDTTHIVFHAAATVRFNETLRRVIHVNVRGTKLVLLLAKEMKNLKAFVHLSTAYSHCELKYIGEKFYKSPMDVDKALKLVDLVDDDFLEQLTPKLIKGWPNTYSYSKAMGEEAIRVYGQDLPLSIVRPSIVISTWKDPIYGWNDTFYGATGVVMGGTLTLMHSFYCDLTKPAEIIPADYVINNVLVAAWDIANKWEEKSKDLESWEIEPKCLDETDIEIYNSVSTCQNSIKWEDFLKLNQIYGTRIPSIHIVWYYFLLVTDSLLLYKIYSFLFHTIPAAIVDGFLAATGRKPMFMKTYQKIHKFNSVLGFFTTNEWQFNNDNVLRLWEKISPVDKEKFDFNTKSLDWKDYMYYHVRGIRIYLVKDKMSTVPIGRAKFRRFKILHYTIITMFFLLVARVFVNYFELSVFWK